MFPDYNNFYGFKLNPARRFDIDIGSEGPVCVYVDHSNNKACVSVYHAHCDANKKIFFTLKRELCHLFFHLATEYNINEVYACLRWDEPDLNPQWATEIFSVVQEHNLLNKQNKMVVYQCITEPPIEHPDIDARIIPRFLITSWIQYQGIDFEWNPHGTGCLYLGGRAFKCDRLLLLKKISESPELSNLIEFSFRYDLISNNADFLEHANRCIDLYNVPGWNNFEEWGLRLHHEVDLFDDSDKINWGYVHLPLDTLSEKKLLLVVESFSDYPEFITEKTFNAICVGMPFLILNDYVACKLAEMGFQSFNHLVGNLKLLPPSIDDFSSSGNRFYDYHNIHAEALLDKTQRFCSRCSEPDFVSEVRQIIEHNKQRAREIVISYQQEYNEYLWMPLNQIWEEDHPPLILSSKD